MKKKSNFCEKPSSPLKDKKCNTQKKLQKKSQKIDFSISKKTTQVSKKKNNSRHIFFY